jgi:putative transposase
VCLDKGYDYREVHELLAEFRSTAHIRRRGEEAQAIKSEAGNWRDSATHTDRTRLWRIALVDALLVAWPGQARPGHDADREHA